MNLTLTSRRRRATRTAGIAAICSLALVTAACGGESSGSDDARALHAGWNALAGNAGFQIALDEGYFADKDLSVEKVELRTPADLVPNILSGKIDFGGLNPGNLAQALAQGFDLKILGVTYYVNNDMSIFSMKDSGIAGPKDLEGKKVGLLQLENPNQAGLMQILEDEGVDTSKVEFTLIPAPEMPAALRSGQIDAGHVVYPLAATLNGEANTVIENIAAPYGENNVQGYVVTSGTFVKEHPDVVADLQSALEHGNETAASDEILRVKAISELTGVDEKLIAGAKQPAYGNDLKLESSQKQLELMQKYHFLDEPVNLADYVYQDD